MRINRSVFTIPMAQALYRKWRSQSFDEVVGQEHVMTTLRNALRDGRVAHAYLFSGPRGTGKTSTARILAKALNCTAAEAERPCSQCAACVAIAEGRFLDLIEIDAASNNSVDDIRDLRDKVGFRPSEGRYKIYIIDEVHMLSTNAFNALLKTLEEPPPHARFILATTEPHKIPATVLSRCQRFDFRRIPVPEISAHLRAIVQAEGFSAEADALTAIARSAQGGMRDAISLLDQMFSYGQQTVTFAQVQQSLGAVNSQAVVSLVNTLAQREVASGLQLIQQLVTQGASLPEFCHQIIEHLRGVMLLQMTGDATLLSDLPTESVAQMQQQAKALSQPTTLFAIKRFSAAVPELKGGYQPQLPLELALVESIQGPPVAPAPVTQAAFAPPQLVALAAAPPANSGAIADSTATEVTHSALGPAPLDQDAIRKLQARWKEIKDAVKSQFGIRVQAALNNVKDVAVAQDTVAFAFGNNQFSRDMVAQPDILPKVAAILSQMLARTVKLECQMGDKAALTNMVIVAPTASESSGDDPLVEFAVGNLGATVVE